MKLLILTLTIQVLSYGTLTFSDRENAWFELTKELNNMIMCGKYWSNHSQYLCDGESYFDYENYWEKGHKKCRCDSKCHEYQDCCLDEADMGLNQSSVEVNHRETCVPLPSTHTSIFMVTKCHPKWSTRNDIRTQNFCESDFEVDDIKTNGSDILSYSVPVHSEGSGHFYKNVYCAVCNFDNHTLTEWEFQSKFCHEYDRPDNETNSVEILLSNNNEWEINYHEIKCLFVINQMESWSEFYLNFKPRPCKPNQTSTCSLSDSPSAKHCPKYLAPVYYIGRLNKLIKIYKNYHCAKCNGAKTTALKRIVCEDHDIKFPVGDRLWPQTTLKSRTNIKMLLNFNFAHGNLVFSDSKCNYNEVYEPTFKRCVEITCGKLYVEKKGRCVLKNSSYSLLKSDCRRAVLYPHEFILLPNKSIQIGLEKLIEPTHYEPNFDENGTLYSVLICTEKILKIIDFDYPQRLLSQICLIISVICLCLHLIVYSIVPSLRNLPGKTLMSMSASLAFADTLFLIGSNFEHKPSACHIIGVFKHYAYLAVFFWTNIMALDIYRTFSRNSVVRLNTSNKTFFKYSIYAWFSPGFIVLIALLLDTFLKDSDYRPRYGQGICWISQRQPLLIFFAIPMAIVLISNGIFFVLTARNINSTVKQTKMASRFSDKLRFVLYVKLATVLGLTWIFGFLAAVADVNVLWYPFILFTGLQGVIIFVAFTFKRKIRDALLQTFRPKSSVEQRRRLRDTKGLSNARSMATSATSLSLSSLNNNKISVDREGTPVRHPRVDYIRVNSQ